MKVRCISNLGKEMPKDCRGIGFDEKTVFDLILGKDYTVYGFTVKSGYIWYYICDEMYEREVIHYPIWQPAPLFEVIDGKMSKYWMCNFKMGYCSEDTFQLVAFEEWVNDLVYYDRLTDGIEFDVEIFKRYKTLMDSE